jgi:hypothetical protein
MKPADMQPPPQARKLNPHERKDRTARALFDGLFGQAAANERKGTFSSDFCRAYFHEIASCTIGRPAMVQASGTLPRFGSMQLQFVTEASVRYCYIEETHVVTVNRVKAFRHSNDFSNITIAKPWTDVYNFFSDVKP